MPRLIFAAALALSLLPIGSARAGARLSSSSTTGTHRICLYENSAALRIADRTRTWVVGRAEPCPPTFPTAAANRQAARTTPPYSASLLREDRSSGGLKCVYGSNDASFTIDAAPGRYFCPLTFSRGSAALSPAP